MHLVLMSAGHRFKPMYDFGYVSLDMLYTYPEDSGVYMCKATNDVGEATTSAEIKCKRELFLALIIINVIY